MLPVQPHDVVRGQYTGYRQEDGVDPESETETFIALQCFIDNWRWAGVPFFLRTGKRLAEGQRIISIAFREPPKRMFTRGAAAGAAVPARLVGVEVDPPADRTARLAVAVRARAARPEQEWRLSSRAAALAC